MSMTSPRAPLLTVLVDHRYAVAGADAVVHAWDLGFDVAEFAALGSVVLSASVEPIDLKVRRIGDQRDLADRNGLGQCDPVLDGSLDGLVAGVGHVQPAATEVVRHRAVGAART